jgi:ribonuclease-3
MDFESLKNDICAVAGGRELLDEALTHRSYRCENPVKYDNQRLEFLGDAVLELILSEWIYHRYADSREGDLTKARSVLAKEATLANLAVQLDLGTHLKAGKGELAAGAMTRQSTLADLFEAVLAAYYLACGYRQTKEKLLELITTCYPDPLKMVTEANPKGKLQEYTQAAMGCTPKYSVLSITGTANEPYYQVEAKVNEFTAAGSGSSRKSAECQAARTLLDFFEKHRLMDK